jgi:hypothetical protein
MEIVLSMLTGESFKLVVEANAAVGAVKETIHELQGLATDLQRLILDRTLLEDDRSLASCGVVAGTTLTLVALPRPQALLEVEVWPERGIPVYTEHGASVSTCAFPATVVRACLSGATDDAANGIYTPAEDQLLTRGSFGLQWMERCEEAPSGWYICDHCSGTAAASPKIGTRVHVRATVRCDDDPDLDGTYHPGSGNGTFEKGNFTLAWHEAPDSYDEMCFPIGWYVEGSGTQSTSCVEHLWWWPLPFASTFEPISTGLASTENSSFAFCGEPSR